MSEEIVAVQSKSPLNRLSAKKQVSMESTQATKALQPSQEIQKLTAMKGEIEHAFSLMHEVRQKLESAYRDLL